MIKLPRPRLGGLLGHLPKLSRPQWMLVAAVVILLVTLGFALAGQQQMAIVIFIVAIVVMLLWWVIDRFVLMVHRQREEAFDAELEKHSKTDELREDWQRAIVELKSTGVDRYTLSFYLLIGEPAGGKTTTLLKSGLNFPIGTNLIRGYGGTRNCNWWFTDEAVILDTAGRYVFHDQQGGLPEEAKQNPEEWLTFLKLVKRYRPRCPINGVIVALPCDSLLKDSAVERERKADIVRNALVEIERTLEIRYPVYVLLTKSDMIGGFVDFFANLKATEQGQLLGWSRPPEARSKPFVVDELDEAFRSMGERFRTWRIKILNEHAERGEAKAVDRAFPFPEEFMRLAPALKEYLGIMFPGGKLVDPLFLRGFYLTSGEQTGVPVLKTIEDALEGRSGGLQESELVDAGEKRVFFIRDFYRKKVLQEPELIQPTRAFVRRVRWVRNAGFTAAGALGVFGILFLTLSYFRLQRDVAGPTEVLEAVVPHVYSNAPEELKDLTEDGDYDKRPAADFGGAADVEKTLRLLADLHLPSGVAPAKGHRARPDDPDNLIPRIDAKEVLSPVWPFGMLPGQKEVLIERLWSVYHTVALKGLIEPFWKDIKAGFGSVRPADIADPKNFDAFQKAMLAFIRLCHRPGSVGDIRDKLGDDDFSKDEIKAALAKASSVSSADLLSWVAQRVSPTHPLATHTAEIAAALDVMLEVDESTAEAAFQDSVFGTRVSTDTTETGEAITAGMILLADRWKQTFRPMDGNDWLVTTGSPTLEAARIWWGAFGVAYHISETVPELDRLALAIQSDRDDMDLQRFRDRYAREWVASSDRSERAVRHLALLTALHPTGDDPGIDCDDAKDELETAWRRSCFAQLVAVAAGIPDEVLWKPIIEKYRSTREDFRSATQELDEFKSGHGKLAEICTVVDHGMGVKAPGCNALEDARKRFPDTSRLMRIALSPMYDREKVSAASSKDDRYFGDVLFKGGAIRCPGPSDLHQAFDALKRIAKAPGGDLAKVTDVAMQAANSSLLEFLTVQETWDSVLQDLSAGSPVHLAFPPNCGDLSKNGMELDRRFKTSEVIHLVRDYVNPIADYARDAPSSFMQHKGYSSAKFYAESLDAKLQTLIGLWTEEWNQLSNATEKIIPVTRARAKPVQSDVAHAADSSADSGWYNDADALLRDQLDTLVKMEAILSDWRSVNDVADFDLVASEGLYASRDAWAAQMSRFHAVNKELAADGTAGNQAEAFRESLSALEKNLQAFTRNGTTFISGLQKSETRITCNKECGRIPVILDRLEAAKATKLVPMQAMVGEIAHVAGQNWSEQVSLNMKHDYEVLIYSKHQESKGFPFFDAAWGGTRPDAQSIRAVLTEDVGDFWQDYQDQLRPWWLDFRRGGFSSAPASWDVPSLPVVKVEMNVDVKKFLAYAHDLNQLASDSGTSGSARKLSASARRVNRDKAQGRLRLADTMDGQITYVGLKVSDPRSAEVTLGRPKDLGKDTDWKDFDVSTSSQVMVGAFSNQLGDAVGDRYLIAHRGHASRLAAFEDGPFPFLEFLVEYADPNGTTYLETVQDGKTMLDSIVLLRLPFDEKPVPDPDGAKPLVAGAVTHGDLLMEVRLRLEDGVVFPNNVQTTVPYWR